MFDASSYFKKYMSDPTLGYAGTSVKSSREDDVPADIDKPLIGVDLYTLSKFISSISNKSDTNSFPSSVYPSISPDSIVAHSEATSLNVDTLIG